jgi:hypothetical protein
MARLHPGMTSEKKTHKNRRDYSVDAIAQRDQQLFISMALVERENTQNGNTFPLIAMPVPV